MVLGFLLPILMVWLALDLTPWRYGWRLLAGRTDAELDALYDGLAPAATAVRADRATPRPDTERVAV